MKELDETEVLESFYNGISPSKIYAPNVQYNEQAKKLGLELIPEKPIFTEQWFMPDEYKNLDLLDYFSKKINSDEEAVRIAEELKLFIDSGNESLIRYCVYLGEVIKNNNVVTGVGRGSSVSVFIFYLCNLHKVNSLKYNLDYREFFKINKGE